MDRLCTIIAQNYLPQAVALLESTRKIYPRIEFFVLIIDAQTNDEPLLPTAHVMIPEDLAIPPEWLTDMRSYYDLVELSTSLKPFLLLTLLTEGISSVTFLDPDVLVLAKLEEGFNAARDSGIALVPHRVTPSDILKDNYSELVFMQYGIFNLGYICVGQSGKEMLNWWAERLRWFCTRFPNDVIFTDQKWMNFVPALFNFNVIRNIGYDLAPWNIDERPLSESDGKYFAGDRELVFVHFSQMSGGLAAGLDTDLWRKALDDSPKALKSLQIITMMTKAYSDTLVKTRNLIATDSLKRANRKQFIPTSFHERRRMITASLEHHRGRDTHAVQTFKFLGTSMRILEKSATFNGIQEGLQKDLRKIAQRLRNFFKK